MGRPLAIENAPECIDALIETGVLEIGNPGEVSVIKQEMKTALVSYATKAFLKFSARKEKTRSSKKQYK